MLALLSTRIGTHRRADRARAASWSRGRLLMALGLLWLARLPVDSAPWKAVDRRSGELRPADVRADRRGALRPSSSGSASRCVVAPLTSTLMGSISGRFSGLGSAINNSISRVGQPLLGRAHLHRDQRHLLRVARLDGRPRHRRPAPSAPPSSHSIRRPAGATAEQVAASNQASIEAFHLAMLGVRRAAGDRRAGRLVRPARGCAVPRRRPPSLPRRPPDATDDDSAVTRDWDARTYDRVADPQTRWGTAVLERLPLDGDERVLDAGCGSGRVTELLANRLPRWARGRPRWLAVDDRRRARAAGAVRRPDRIRRRRPRAAASDRRDGRRDPVDRDLPLGARPRRAVQEPGRRPPSRRVARRAMRRLRQHRVGQARAGDDRRRLARPCPLRDADGHRPPPGRRRLRRHRMLADRRTDTLRAGRAARDLHAHGDPGARTWNASRRGARRLRARGGDRVCPSR